MADVVQSWDALKPQLEAAATKERDIRLGAWLDFPRKLCGEETNQLRLRDYTLLEAAGNPFVVGGIPSPGAVAQFVWFLSPDFTLDDSARERFLKRVSKYNFAKAVKEIREYITEVFFDLPETGGTSGPSDRLFIAAIVHRMAKEYGWDAEQTMETPMQQIFQLVRCQARDNGASAYSPLQGEVKSKWLEQVNKGER